MPSSRRKILASAAAACTLPLAATTLGGRGAASAAPLASANDEELKIQMLKRLSAELNDPSAAAELYPHILDIGFNWSLPSIPATQIDRIVAYAFGNRPNAASGNTGNSGENQAALPDPGPINEKLADAVYRIHQLKPVKIYAQWEIARFLVAKHKLDPVSIEPLVAADGTITYLSTDGVAAAVVKIEGDASKMGKVAIIGHRDHAKRCIATSRQKGMDAYAVNEVELPVEYDALSGQAWTRRRDLYLVHDMSAQFAMLRSALVAKAYPNG